MTTTNNNNNNNNNDEDAVDIFAWLDNNSTNSPPGKLEYSMTSVDNINTINIDNNMHDPLQLLMDQLQFPNDSDDDYELIPSSASTLSQQSHHHHHQAVDSSSGSIPPQFAWTLGNLQLLAPAEHPPLSPSPIESQYSRAQSPAVSVLSAFSNSSTVFVDQLQQLQQPENNADAVTPQLHLDLVDLDFLLTLADAANINIGPPSDQHNNRQQHSPVRSASLSPTPSESPPPKPKAAPYNTSSSSSPPTTTTTTTTGGSHAAAGKPMRMHACPYPDCDRSFKRRYNLTSHIRGQHTHERPYACVDCDASFARSHDLARHRVTAHSVLRKFQCDRCASTFGRSDALKRHRSTCILRAHDPAC